MAYMLHQAWPQAARAPANGAQDQPQNRAGQQAFQAERAAQDDMRQAEQQAADTNRHEGASVAPEGLQEHAAKEEFFENRRHNADGEDRPADALTYDFHLLHDGAEVLDL